MPYQKRGISFPEPPEGKQGTGKNGKPVCGRSAIQHPADRDHNNAERGKSTKERRERESIYRRDKYARTHARCSPDSFEKGVCKSIIVKIKQKKAS